METTLIDLKIENTNVYNSYFKTFIHGDVWIKGGKILYIDELQDGQAEAGETVNGSGLFMIPGLIDIHMHIESSMMTPGAFCDYIRRCGVTTIVSEPHEIANVAGIRGVRDMIAAGGDSPVDIFYGIPSCVPSTSAELETTGGVIGCSEMAELRKESAVACVGEVMSYRQIIKENDLEIGKYIRKLRQTDQIFPIEGHCPSLVGLDLAKFLYLGINGDHTEHTIEELRQRFAGGMFVEIQEKMLKKEVLDYIEANRLHEHFCFVTDDVMADTLIEQGQLDALVRKAIALGMKPEQAIYNATYTPARRMNLLDRGTLAPGKRADFSLVSDLSALKIESVYKDGQAVWKSGEAENERQKTRFPEAYYNSIRIGRQEESTLTVRAELADGRYLFRAIEVCPGGTRTKEKLVEMEVKDRIVQWEESECLLAAVYERYGKNGGIGHGFLTGVCHQRGAVATSYAHDSHNIFAAGKTKRDILAAVNTVIGMQGGMAVSENGQVIARLPLPVGGILSDEPAVLIGKGLGTIRSAMEKLGYRHYNPIMSFATLTLPVSPSLKLTDKGLVDVEQGEIVPLYQLDR